MEAIHSEIGGTFPFDVCLETGKLNTLILCMSVYTRTPGHLPFFPPNQSH